jgi:asparagine synthase (glutamine-hydrolysing)
MCGITGYAGFDEPGLVEAMTAALAHRGPDDCGFYRGEEVALGHRRLSIIDVAGGHQPIENEDGTLVVIANGEVYNYQELNPELEARGHRFRTRSDNETLLHLYEEHGPAALARTNGMFAFAIWNARERELFLARDRLGIKPLYYAELTGGGIAFASEAKALLRCRRLASELDPAALHAYLALRYVPGPGGLLRGIHKLPAGHHLTWRDGRTRIDRWWEPRLASGPFERRSDEEWVEGFAERFERSVRRRLISEVPVGAYLSGGLDSSTIAAAFSRATTHPVRTFTVGFDFQHDELEAAARTARELGTEHAEIACRASDVALLPEIVWHLDEPVGDPIVIPMFQLAREAKRKVTVILTGEGADEVLGGYLFHRALLSGMRIGRIVPRALRRALAPLVARVPPGWLDRLFHYPAPLGRRGRQKLADLCDLLGPAELPRAYLHLISLFDRRDTHELYTDILTKQDKMTMASAIEGRVPFLDHELVEYALALPPHMKIRRGSEKHVLRRYAARLLPERVTRGAKMPFYNPIERALDEPAYRALVDDALSDQRVRARGIFRPEAIARLRASLAGGEFVHAKQVFSLVVLELWFQMAVDRHGAPA